MPNYYDHFGAATPFTASGVNTELDKLDAQIKTNADDIVVLQSATFDPLSIIPQARLSLSSSLPVSTADVTAATSVYLHPFAGTTVPLYDGADWQARALSSAVSIAIPSTTSTVYDVFAYWNTSVIALEVVAWSTATARATALTTQNGINVKTGDATRRYMGTFRTTTVSGQSEDSVTKRFLWNMYNRRSRSLGKADVTASWVYSTATWRQANATSTNRVEVVLGLNEAYVDVSVFVLSVCTAALCYVGVGLDTTTANSAQLAIPSAANFAPSNAHYKGYPGVGYHALNWVEIGGSSGTTTFYGPAGMTGQVAA